MADDDLPQYEFSAEEEQQMRANRASLANRTTAATARRFGRAVGASIPPMAGVGLGNMRPLAE